MPQTAGTPDTPHPPPDPAPGQVAAHAAMRQAAIVLIAAIIAADQFSKWLVLELVMQPARVVEILPFFNVVLVYNRGISFGILGAGSAVQTWLLIALAIIIVVLLLGMLLAVLSNIMLGKVFIHIQSAVELPIILGPINFFRPLLGLAGALRAGWSPFHLFGSEIKEQTQCYFINIYPDHRFCLGYL